MMTQMCRTFRQGQGGMEETGWVTVETTFSELEIGPQDLLTRASHRIALCLSFLICKAGMTIVPISKLSWQIALGKCLLFLLFGGYKSISEAVAWSSKYLHF